MIRLAVIYLPFLAMACASADEPVGILGLPELHQLPSFYGPNCQRGRQYWSESWQRGLPPSISSDEINAAIQSPTTPNAGCNVQAFAIRQYEPPEYWLLCENGVVNLSFRPDSSEGNRAIQIVTSCNPGRRDALTPNPLNVINQENTQERSD
jgi:hypothetical protein